MYLFRWVLYVSAALLLIGLLSSLLKVQLEIKVIIKNSKNYSYIIVRLLNGKLRIRVNMSVKPGKNGLFSVTVRKTDSAMENETNFVESMEMFMRMSQMYKKYREQTNYLKSKLKIENFSIYSRVGTGDAAATAIAYGGFFTVFSVIARHLKNRYSLQKQKIVILPFFQGSVFDLDLDCIINFKLGHIMITGMKMLLKNIKGGETNG